MRTRPASIATVVIAIGLALTSIGLARSLPYTFGGVGDRATIGSDLWAHGTAVSPALVALVALGLLAAIAMRPTAGGRRAARWVAVLGAVLVLAGLFEPAQQDVILLTSLDLALTPLVYAFHLGLVALVLAAIGEVRGTGESTVNPSAVASVAVPEPAGAGRGTAAPVLGAAAA